MAKIMYATVKLVVKDSADVDDITAETDYNFEHEDIIETELIDLKEKANHG
tara:strand:- start:231 stop:383 length:153 start_codon:yes stop_codon:yes gene_type:complete